MDKLHFLLFIHINRQLFIHSFVALKVVFFLAILTLTAEMMVFLQSSLPL